MNNLIACLVFNIVGLGSYSFLSLLSGERNVLEKPGTAVFFGSWASLLFTYILWLCMPSRLDIACYLTFAISTIGVGILFKKEGIISLLKSEYIIAFLCLTPFIFIVTYNPISWDEFSHWLIAPKAFYYQRTLAPLENGYGMLVYTPLWTLQSAFFQFFTFENFSEAVIYAVRLNVFLAFIFFVKEISKLRFLTTFLWVLGVFCFFKLFHVYNHLLIEFPVCLLIASSFFIVEKLEKNKLNNIKNNIVLLFVVLLSVYMVKIPLIALIPAGVIILWFNDYKKQVFYFLILFFIFYFSWKIKSSVLPGDLPIDLQISLWGTKAINVYTAVINKSFFTIPQYFILLFLSLCVLLSKNKNSFWFCLIYSIAYLAVIVCAYVLAFSDFEASYAVSYERYMGVVFVPVFIFTLAVILSDAQKFIDRKENFLKSLPASKYIFSACLSASLIIFSYFSAETQHFLLAGYEQIKKVYDVKDKSMTAISQGGSGSQFLMILYASYGEAKSVDGGSFGPIKDNDWRTVVDRDVFLKRLKDTEVIIVLETDDWLNNIFLELTTHKTDGMRNFALLKKDTNYEIVRF